METKDTVLYIHTSKDDGGIFYVGIGSKNRPYDKTNRGNFWKKYVNECGGFDVTILKTDMTWEEACDLEIKMIAFYGRIKPSKKNLNYGCLVNKTDGGQGTKGLVWSEESKKKQSERFSGENNPKFGKKNPHHSIRMVGNSNPMFGKGEKIKGGKNGRSKKVVCDVTNKIYNCIKEAAEDIGILPDTLSMYLRGISKNKTSLRYY